MKPRYLFALVIVMLLGGTLFSRYTRAGDIVKSDMVFGDTVRSLPRGTFVEASIPMTRIAGTAALGEGEARALKRITQLLDARGRSDDAPVGVTWTETYRQRAITLRAYYLPREKALVCGTGPRDTYVYQPVTREGMETALQEGRKAPFASANLYSLPHLAAR